MNKAVIIHCWTGYPEYCWYPYVKQELTKKGYAVEIPFFADLLPYLGTWLKKIQAAVGQPDEDTVLIGHSLGAIAIMKYLQDLRPDQKVGGVVLVAGFINDLGVKPLHSFFEQPVDFEKIKTHAHEFVLVSSDNDPYIKPHHTQILKDKLGARVIWISREHFTEDKQGREYKQFPEVIKAVEKIERAINRAEERQELFTPILTPAPA